MTKIAGSWLCGAQTRTVTVLPCSANWMTWLRRCTPGKSRNQMMHSLLHHQQIHELHQHRPCPPSVPLPLRCTGRARTLEGAHGGTSSAEEYIRPAYEADSDASDHAHLRPFRPARSGTGRGAKKFSTVEERQDLLERITSGRTAPAAHPPHSRGHFSASSSSSTTSVPVNPHFTPAQAQAFQRGLAFLS